MRAHSLCYGQRALEISVPTLRSELEPFLSALAHVHYRRGAGLAAGRSDEESVADVLAAYPAFCRPETFQMVEESLRRAQAKEAQDAVRRFRALRELLATQVEDAFAGPAQAEMDRLQAEGEVVTPTGRRTFAEACAQLPTEEDRLARAATERALSAFLRDHASPYARRVEAAARCAQALGRESYLALRAEVTGIDTAALATDARALLHETEDAWRDVLGYALRKLDPRLRPLPQGDASRPDLLRLALAPHLLEHFPRSALVSSVRRSIEELGFHPTAHGRIRVDTEARPGKSPRPFVAAVGVPDDVRLVVHPGQGMEDYVALLHEYGHALHFAHAPAMGTVEDRRLADASVTEGFAFVFAHFLLEERWLRRYLGVGADRAKDVARIATLNALGLLRRHAARLLYEVELYRRGPSPALAATYREELEAALFVRVPEGFYLFDADPQLYGARYLRGWALEAQLTKTLRERFDEDYFRNPASGRYLEGLFGLGGTHDAEGLARLVGADGLSLQAAGARLVDGLNR